ncbi:MAG TPA: methyltransferase domain-containing protein [Candidatus Eisenbacteria bacterium]|nr:methyltransferase domain-containing protein [Candidatus Eisenbacteria bacterium]
MKIKSAYCLLSLLLCFAGYQAHAQPARQEPQPAAKQLRAPDVVFVPTPYEAVDAMLKVAKVGSDDIVYDLGSGDGRIPIMAVQKYNAARAVGIDINPERISEAEANRKAAGVGDRVRFLNEDLFEANISEATVVTLYLLPSLNLKLLPKLLAELKPGTRIVSHAFDMGSWKPQQTLSAGGSTIYFWTIPAKGTPEYAAAAKAANPN